MQLMEHSWVSQIFIRCNLPLCCPASADSLTFSQGDGSIVAHAPLQFSGLDAPCLVELTHVQICRQRQTISRSCEEIRKRSKFIDLDHCPGMSLSHAKSRARLPDT